MNSRNKMISARYYEAWNSGNLDIANEIFASDFEIHDPASPVPIRPGPEGVNDRIRLYRSAFPDLSITVHEQLAEDDKVVTRWTLDGTHRQSFCSIAPTGRAITVTGMTIHRIHDGKIVEAWVNWDTDSLWSRLRARKK
jgi:steroid delta-isomerase-like uncharacterized protein